MHIVLLLLLLPPPPLLLSIRSSSIPPNNPSPHFPPEISTYFSSVSKIAKLLRLSTHAMLARLRLIRLPHPSLPTPTTVASHLANANRQCWSPASTSAAALSGPPCRFTAHDCGRWFSSSGSSSSSKIIYRPPPSSRFVLCHCVRRFDS